MIDRLLSDYHGAEDIADHWMGYWQDVLAENPTLLNGYGAYGFSQTARFSSAELAWIEQGGVIALANVRGSGVYGRDWYQGGFKSTKRNTWLDGIACARLLIERGFASPQTLAVSGGSAGGIFAGRAMSAAPELFAAAILYVGVLDAVRAEESANGITNISEFGTVKDSLEFKALLEMSTFHQIRDGVAYPAVMLVHGLNDPRVDVWNSAKTAARLQAASNSQRPILLRLDEQAGHGMGSTATQRRGEQADVYAFLLWQMGKTSLARN
jgi:prolyl oligopeptidase